MNKLTTIVAAASVTILSFASTANSVEFKAGVSAQTAAYYGSVEETLKDSGRKTSEDALVAFSYASIFGEVAFDSAYGISLGIEFTPDSIELNNADRIIKGDAATNAIRDNTEDTTVSDHGDVQTIQAAVSDLTQIYLGIPLMDTGLTAKVSYTMAVLETKETLSTSSSYKDEDMEGYSVGIYYDGTISDNLFYRLEGAYQTFDDLKIAGSEVGGTAGSYNSITAQLGGVAAKASIGFNF